MLLVLKKIWDISNLKASQCLHSFSDHTDQVSIYLGATFIILCHQDSTCVCLIGRSGV